MSSAAEVSDVDDVNVEDDFLVVFDEAPSNRVLLVEEATAQFGRDFQYFVFRHVLNSGIQGCQVERGIKSFKTGFEFVNNFTVFMKKLCLSKKFQNRF